MSNRILSYRALLAHGAQDRILLSTKKGEIGYRIIKFQLLPDDSGGHAAESTVKVYKTEQAAVSNIVDFSDNRLLAAGYISNHTSGYIYPPRDQIIFENEIFNQDIFVTHYDRSGDAPCNYYIELERIKLSEHDSMVTTLKDIRNND